MPKTLIPLVLMLTTAPGTQDRDADEVVKAMQEAAGDPTSEAFRSSLLEAALHPLAGVTIEERCRALAEVLSQGRVFKTRSSEGSAAVALKQDRNTREVLLRQIDDKWQISSLTAYLVEGKDLKDRTGRKPSTVKLTSRAEAGDYGPSAFCFTYVTALSEECKNRMDLWLCHNQDLHAIKSGTILSLGKASLKSIDRIPVEGKWAKTAKAEAGHCYVVHCLDSRDRDFHVKLRVKALKKGVATIEWSLLSVGPGTPANITKAQPLKSNDGADATDGLCPKRD